MDVGSAVRYLYLHTSTSRTVQTLMGDGGSTRVNEESTGLLEAGNWTMLTWVRRGTNLSFYMDGSVDWSTDNNYLLNIGGYNLYLGRHSGAAVSQYNGQMDAFKIYDRALTDDEINGLINEVEGVLYNTSANQWYYATTKSDLPEGTYYYNLTAYGSENSTETRSLTIDLTGPEINLTSPENASTETDTFDINFTANITDTTSNVSNATLYIYNASDDLYNQTTVTFGGDTLTEVVGIVVTMINGVYTWFYSAFDILGNEATSENYTLTVDLDLINPGVEFISPTPADGFIGAETSHTINVSIEEENLDNVSFRFTGITPVNCISHEGRGECDELYVSEGLLGAWDFNNLSIFNENDTYVADVADDGYDAPCPQIIYATIKIICRTYSATNTIISIGPNNWHESTTRFKHPCKILTTIKYSINI